MPSARSTLLSVISSHSPSDEPPRPQCHGKAPTCSLTRAAVNPHRSLKVNASLLDDGVGRYLGIRSATRGARRSEREENERRARGERPRGGCYSLGAKG